MLFAEKQTLDPLHSTTVPYLIQSFMEINFLAAFLSENLLHVLWRNRIDCINEHSHQKYGVVHIMQSVLFIYV